MKTSRIQRRETRRSASIRAVWWIGCIVKFVLSSVASPVRHGRRGQSRGLACVDTTKPNLRSAPRTCPSPCIVKFVRQFKLKLCSLYISIKLHVHHGDGCYIVKWWSLQKACMGWWRVTIYRTWGSSVWLTRMGNISRVIEDVILVGRKCAVQVKLLPNCWWSWWRWLTEHLKPILYRVGLCVAVSHSKHQHFQLRK